MANIPNVNNLLDINLLNSGPSRKKWQDGIGSGFRKSNFYVEIIFPIIKPTKYSTSVKNKVIVNDKKAFENRKLALFFDKQNKWCYIFSMLKN